MVDQLLQFAPVVATVFAVPQFLPQLAKVWRDGDTAGVAWSWAALTSVNNAAWAVYFALSGTWMGLVPAFSAVLLAGVLAVMIARRGGISARGVAFTCAGAAVLAGALVWGGRVWLGNALTAGFVMQVAPSVWAAYRTRRPSGISCGTWLLILGELACWAVFGLATGDPRLIALGGTGVVASLLVLARVAWTRRRTTKHSRHPSSMTDPATTPASAR